MPWLTLNDYEIPVASARELTPEELGPGARAYLGQFRKSRRAIKSAWQFTTPLVTAEVAHTIKGLVQGLGWRIGYSTSLYADGAGLGPDTGYSVSLVASSPTPILGAAKCLRMASGSTAVKLQYAAEMGAADYTLACWISLAGSATWHHYVRRVSADGGTTTLWKDGASTSNFYTVQVDADGNVELRGVDPDDNSTTDTVAVQDLLILPYAAEDDLLTAIYGGGSATASAFSDLPGLRAEGDFIEQASAAVVGKDFTADYGQARIDGAWHSNARACSFTLLEV